MQDDFDDILNDAQNMTNEQFAIKISELLNKPINLIQSEFPTQTDKQYLIKLLNVVKTASSDNNAKNEIITNITAYAKVVIGLVKLFV
jgi:hypothetical protein